jgi:hypothetical protein
MEKPKKTRKPKKIPTKEELLKMIVEGEAELKKALEDLQIERPKISSLGLVLIPQVIDNEIEELKQDLEDLEASKKEVNEMEESK